MSADVQPSRPRPVLIYRGPQGETEVTRAAMREVWAKAGWHERVDMVHAVFSLAVGPVVVALALVLLVLGEGLRGLLMLGAGLILTATAVGIIAWRTWQRVKARRARA